MKQRACLKKSKRKGTTLAEISIVLAVISIVSLAVVSFTTMVSARSTVGVAKIQSADDLRLTEVIIRSWTDAVVQNPDAELSVTDGALTATVGDATYKVELTEADVLAPLPDGRTLSCPVSRITELRFEEMKKTGDAIYFCTAVYEIPHPTQGAVIRDFTFCINSHIGELLADTVEAEE